jgi:transcriptional regulator with XRE-family HTH domain
MTESELYEELGRLVRQHRERLGMSQEKLAEAIELSRASVANIETGRQRIPLHHLYRLARALKVEAGALLPRAKRPVAGVMDRPISASLNLNEREEADVARVLGTMAPPTRRT